MALGVLINGFANIGVVSFDKELNFQKRFIYRSVPNVVDLAVSVGFAIVLRSPWALVFGWLAFRLSATSPAMSSTSFGLAFAGTSSGFEVSFDSACGRLAHKFSCI